MKEAVLQTKDYCLYFEHINENSLIAVHCDVTTWNKQVKKEIIPSFYKVFKNETKPLLVFIDNTNTKLKKFATLFGFILFKEDVPILSGELKDMYIWKDL